MATTINKQKIVTQILGAAGKHARHAEPAPRPVLEQFLYAICREETTRAAADRAFAVLEQRFFDWNELRVSAAEEVADALQDAVPDAGARAQRIIDFLQEVFETTYSFDLEGLHKKGLKQAARSLERYAAANAYSVAWVVQHSLGGHAIPLDAAGVRVLRRVGLLEEEGDAEAQRASLEHQVPKAKGVVFLDVISDIASTACFEDAPKCPSCALHHACITGAEYKAHVSHVSKKPR